MSLNLVTLTWDFTDLIQSGDAGILSIQPTSQLTDVTDGLIIPALPPRLVTFSGGTGQLAGIVANDNVNITPTGTGYIITVTAPNGQVIYGPVTVVINFAAGATQKLSSLTPAVIGPVVTTYMLQPTGTPTSGYVPVASGAGEASAWTSPPGGSPTGAAGGDLGSTYPNPTVTATHLAAALPVAQGGTGQTAQQAAINALTGTQSAGKYLRSDGTNATLAAIQAADVPTLNQSTTGTAANVTGTVAIANGGTGAATQQAALDALAGAVTTGLVLRGNGTHVTLAALQASDVPTLNQSTTGTAANVTGIVAIANGGTNSSSRVWAGLLTPTAVKTGAYTAAAGDFVPCDTTSGAFTVTLPNAPADLTVVAVKMVAQGGTNAVTIARGGTDVFNVTGGGTSLTLALLFQGVLLQYKASGGIWYVVADDLPMGGLDGRYVLASALPLAIGSGGTGQATQQAAINALTGTQSAGRYLRSDGTNATLAAIVAGDVPTLNQNTTGTAAGLSSTLAIGSGGTGQVTAAAAYSALSPMTTLGDLEYESGAGTASRLAGNTSAMKNFLTQTGTGSVSAAPAWGAIAAGDLPAGTTSTQGALQLDGTASDIQQAGTAAAAGATGKAADAGHVHASPSPLPADFGWLAWVFDPASAVAATTPTGGTVTLAAFFLRKTTTISNIIVVVTAGSGLTSGQNFAGIYDSSGTRQGVTADQTTPWGSAGAKTMALTSAYANAPAGMYYVAVVSNGTTPPAFRGTGQIAPGNAGLAAASLRFAANGTAQTSLPATITPGSATTTNAIGFCAVLS